MEIGQKMLRFRAKRVSAEPHALRRKGVEIVFVRVAGASDGSKSPPVARRGNLKAFAGRPKWGF